MNRVPAILLSLLAALALCAEEARVMPDVLAGSAQVWIEENVDDWVFSVAGIERETVDQSLARIHQELHDLVAHRAEPQAQDAEQMLSLLNEFEETRPLEDWLRSLLDQARAAASETNAPTPSITVPEAPASPNVWLSIMSQRPVPRKADAYLGQIKPIFRSERVPEELVWLAEVESAFDPQAKSPVGAVGLFQLMPATAKSLGLSTWFPDERRDAEKNARAAAQYLQYLHDRFGDWPLALAAYNAGPTRVSKLLRKSGGQSYEAIAGQLPSETRDYVAKVEATLFVREGVELAALSKAEQ